MTAAALTSLKLISAFRPRYIAMIGIAAGIRGRCQLGDIVVADPGWDWGSGKIAIANAGPSFQNGSYQIGLDSFLRTKLNVFAEDAVALDSIR